MVMSVKGMLFDFGNVLGLFDKEKAYTRLSYDTSRSLEEIRAIMTELEPEVESGRLRHYEYLHAVRDRLGVRGLSLPDIERIVGNIISPNRNIVPFVTSLMERGVPIGIVSNTSEVHWRYAMDVPIMQELRRYGATMTLSYIEGSMKPEERIYSIALERLGLDAPSVLYIDDILSHVVAARHYGLRAEVYLGIHMSRAYGRQFFQITS